MNQLLDNSNIGSEWSDINRLREIAGRFVPEELCQAASEALRISQSCIKR